MSGRRVVVVGAGRRVVVVGAGRRVVIVGAGHAGVALAAALRQARFDGHITLISDEPGLPYHRPPLSKAFLQADAGDEAALLRPATFFADGSVDLLAPERVLAIERAERKVRLVSGRSIAYDHLVLATGSRNRQLDVPGADLPNVHALRTMADARAIRAGLPGLRSAVVVGAGFIGLEFAAAAARQGARVTVVETAPRIMRRSVSAAMASRLQAHHEALGATFVLNRSVRAMTQAGGELHVALDDGRTLSARMVVVGIGAMPNTELAEAAGLEVDDGIVVDEGLATSDPSISAVGDCVNAPNAFGHRPRTRLESVQNANDGARLLAARLTGAPAAGTAAIPWFWSDQGPFKLQIVGLAAPDDLELVLGGERSFSVLRYRADRLVCVESANRAADHLIARKLLAQGGGPSLAQAEAGTIDLRAFA